MTNVLHPDERLLGRKHHENVVASLNHRLAIAKANQDQRLVELLEQEKRQIAGDIDRQSGFLRQHLVTLWQDVGSLIRGDSSLKVWQTVDSLGDQWWCAYDPTTGQSMYTDSETEMRIWIESNHPSEAH